MTANDKKPKYYDSTIEAPPDNMDIYYSTSGHRMVIDEIKRANRRLAILDVGCGNGLLDSMLLGDNEVHGVDIHQEKIDLCNSKGIIAKLIKPDYILPYKDNTFDVVIILQVLEHLMDPDKMLREINRVLKPGGSILITVPNMYDLDTRFHFLFGSWSKIVYGANLGHIRFFSKKTLKKLVEDENYIIYKNISYDFCRYLLKPISLVSYVLSFICNPVDFSGLRLRKQKINNNIELLLSNIMGFSSFGGNLLIFAKKRL